MLVTRKIEIDMGHRVPNHKSKCKNLHGHRYVIEVGVDDKVIKTMGSSDEGMVIDFGDLKQVMMEVIDADFDHGFVMYEHDVLAPVFVQLAKKTGQKIIFTSFIPTAENLAEHWYYLLKKKLLERNIRIAHIRVWETPNCSAMFSER